MPIPLVGNDELVLGRHNPQLTHYWPATGRLHMQLE